MDPVSRPCLRWNSHPLKKQAFKYFRNICQNDGLMQSAIFEHHALAVTADNKDGGAHYFHSVREQTKREALGTQQKSGKVVGRNTRKWNSREKPIPFFKSFKQRVTKEKIFHVGKKCGGSFQSIRSKEIV